MATPSWQVTGQYYETCSCDFVCPCVPGQLAVMPTKGDCTVAMAFQIERGSYGTVPLDGLGFIVLLWTPEAMGKGNWSVGVIADAQASAEQHEAITSIASGSAGGPMAALSALVGKFLGVESAPDPIRSRRREMVGHGSASSSTWPPKGPWESTPPSASRSIWRIRAIPPRAASPSPMQQRATLTPWA